MRSSWELNANIITIKLKATILIYCVNFITNSSCGSQISFLKDKFVS